MVRVKRNFAFEYFHLVLSNSGSVALLCFSLKKHGNASSLDGSSVLLCNLPWKKPRRLSQTRICPSLQQSLDDLPPDRAAMCGGNMPDFPQTLDYCRAQSAVNMIQYRRGPQQRILITNILIANVRISTLLKQKISHLKFIFIEGYVQRCAPISILHV